MRFSPSPYLPEWLRAYRPVDLSRDLAAGAVVCAAACAWVRQAWARRGLLAALALLAGWGVAARDADGRRREAAWFAERRPRQVYLCRVGPEVRVTPQRGNAARFSFRAEGFRCEEGSVAFRRLPVTVQWYGARAAEGVDAPRPGEVWRLAGSGRVRGGRNGLPELTVSTGQERSGRVADACATRDLAFGGVTVPAAQVQAAFLAALNGAFANVQTADEIGT